MSSTDRRLRRLERSDDVEDKRKLYRERLRLHPALCPVCERRPGTELKPDGKTCCCYTCYRDHKEYAHTFGCPECPIQEAP